MTTANPRMAYIAREPNQPGAVAYINAEIIHTPGAQRLVEGWIERGCLVQKVTLAEAIAEFCRYSAAAKEQKYTYVIDPGSPEEYGSGISLAEQVHLISDLNDFEEAARVSEKVREACAAKEPTLIGLGDAEPLPRMLLKQAD
jgi:hypothetical protein